MAIQSSSPRTAEDNFAGSIWRAAATLAIVPEVLNRTLGR